MHGQIILIVIIFFFRKFVYKITVPSTPKILDIIMKRGVWNYNTFWVFLSKMSPDTTRVHSVWLTNLVFMGLSLS